MQTEYSNGKNLCKAEASPDGEQEDETASSCLTLDQVAVAWVSGIAPINKDDAQQMCVPAVVIAAAGGRLSSDDSLPRMQPAHGARVARGWLPCWRRGGSRRLMRRRLYPFAELWGVVQERWFCARHRALPLRLDRPPRSARPRSIRRGRCPPVGRCVARPLPTAGSAALRRLRR